MSQEFQSQFMEQIKQNSGLTIGMGVIVLLMGLLAMGSPFVSGLSLAMMIGVMLVIGGVGQLIFAIKTYKGVFAILLGLLTVAIGAYMVTNAAAALASLTLFLAAYLVVSSIFEAVMAFQLKPVKDWGWTLSSGIVSMLLGAMIWSQFPLSGAWAIGILIGVKLFFSGLTLLIFGLAARGVSKELIGAV